jgi:hypothetical protein
MPSTTPPSAQRDALRSRFRKEIFGQLHDKRAQMRLVVTAEVIRLVGLQIEKGQPADPARWAKLRAFVEGQDGALALVDRLEEALRQCEVDIQKLLEDGGGDERAMRLTAAKQIRIALAQMLRAPLPDVPPNGKVPTAG